MASSYINKVQEISDDTGFVMVVNVHDVTTTNTGFRSKVSFLFGDFASVCVWGIGGRHIRFELDVPTDETSDITIVNTEEPWNYPEGAHDWPFNKTLEMLSIPSIKDELTRKELCYDHRIKNITVTKSDIDYLKPLILPEMLSIGYDKVLDYHYRKD